MLCTSIVSSLTLHIVLLAVVSSAPTHHLTIGVDGNTPTLIVTSSEIGITSDIERSHVKTPKTRKDLKSNDKLKSLKAKNSMNKKDKSFYFTKNSAATTTPSFHAASTFASTSIYTTPSNVALRTTLGDSNFHAVATELSPMATSTLHTVSTLNSKSATGQMTETSIGDDNDRNKMEPTTENDVLLLTTLPAKTTSSTSSPPTENTIKTTATRLLRTTSTDNDTVEISTTETMETTNAAAMNGDSIGDKHNRPEYGQDVSFEISTPTATAIAPSEDLVQVFTSTESIVTNDAIHVHTELSTQMESTSTLPPGSSPEPTNNETTTVSDGLPSTSTESILKLIDLEKHDPSTFDGVSQDGAEYDNGHDGLKTIKKKQLVDKHYLDAIRHTKQVDDLKEGIPKASEVKHGYLGPISMEEKTLHASEGSNVTIDPISNKKKHILSTESQLRKGHFVEITASREPEIVTTATAIPQDESTAKHVGLKETVRQTNEVDHGPSTVLSTTVFQVADIVAANTMFTSTDDEEQQMKDDVGWKIESKISDIQIEVYDSTIDSIVASTNFKDTDTPTGKSTKPPLSAAQQERFTQYVIDRTETSTQESINFSTIQVASGKPEPAAIEIHINVSESLGNNSEDVDLSFPLSEYNNNGRGDDTSYDDVKANDDIKLKITSNAANKDRSDEVLVVEIVDNADNATEAKGKSRNSDDLFITDVKETFATPPPPPPFQQHFDRDSDTIFYISNTEVKVGETLPEAKKAFDERKIKLENQFFPVNYMASTHPNVHNANNADDASDHHLYEEDIILSSNRNQADSLKIYRNRNEPSPPLDVTYVGESIIEVEQSPDSSLTTSFTSDHMITPQPDVIIQPAILPEISIGVPVIGELPPQIELKEIDFMPSETQLRRSGVYGNANDDSNNINANAINSGISDVDNRLDESSIQYGGDLIDESADGGFDGVEGSYPFGNPATMTKRKQNHIADYTHLYVNYGVNNMRKDELTADVKDSGEVAVILEHSAVNGANANEQNATYKEFLNKVVFNITSGLNESERISNVTAFSIMEDSNGIDDKNTEDIINLISLAIGLFIVILPVVVTCSMLWALRYLYKKYHSNSTDSNGNLDPADTKSQPNEDAAEKGESVQESAFPSHNGHDKDDIQKCPESSTNPSADNSVVKFATEQASPLDSSLDSQCKMYSCSSKARHFPLSLALHPMTSETQSVHEGTSQGPNGSITKMTLENNLLIVETEERNDMSRVARETKMDYNKDGVFVVEVARGIDSRTIPDSPVTEGADKMLSMFEPKHNGNGTMGYKMSNEKISHNNEKVQIHSPPPEKTEDGPRSLHQIEEVDEPAHSPRLHDVADVETVGLTYKSNIGLSQSDLSSTSSNDSNKGYCYGNQELYVVEQSGYSTSTPTPNAALKCDSKDIKDDDRNSENGRHLKLSPDRREEARDTEDVLDTVNSQQKTETVNEKHIAQDERQNEKDMEIETLVTNQTTSETFRAQDQEEDRNVVESAPSVTEQTDATFEILHEQDQKEDRVNVEVETLVTNKTDTTSETVHELAQKDETNIVEGEAVGTSQTDTSSETFDEELVEQDQKEDKIIGTVVKNQSDTNSETVLEKNVEQDQEETADDVEIDPIITDQTDFNFNSTFNENCFEQNHKENTNDIEIEALVSNKIDASCGETEVVPSEEEPLCNGHAENTSIVLLSENTGEGIPSNEHLEISSDHSTVHSENNLHLNGSHENSKQEQQDFGEDKKTDDRISDKNGPKTNSATSITDDIANKSPHVNNGSDMLPDLVPAEEHMSHTICGELNCEPTSNCVTEFENGYDSIISLPEPPPTTDDMLYGDLSELQLDSLPPPPPPLVNELNGETFTLKDLPPPLTNSGSESLPNEDAANFYASLPPPPPTTLHVSTTPTINGNMHASPLTPPASPPPHFTSGLHAALCPPIAVDVNGS